MSNFIYPNISHLPWSKWVRDGDVIQTDLNHLNHNNIIVLEKMDGIPVIISSDRIIFKKDVSDISKEYLESIRTEKLSKLSNNIWFVGDILLERRLYHYDMLPDYFLLYGMFVNDIFLNWEVTAKYAEELSLKMVPILYKGIYDEELIKKCYTGESVYGKYQEGYIVRRVDTFLLDSIKTNILKYVSRDKLDIASSNNKLFNRTKEI